MLFFIIFAFPMVMLASGMSVDYVRIVIANRQISQTADGAAIAGAFQFQTGRASLDQPRARQVARDSFNFAVGQGAASQATVVSTDVNATSQTVSVRSNYQVRGLLFLGYLSGGRNSISLSIEREASVCIPGSNPATNGSCLRPSG